MATQTVYSDSTNEGSIRIDTTDYGSIRFYRRVSAAWQQQNYYYTFGFDGRMSIVWLDSAQYQTHLTSSIPSISNFLSFGLDCSRYSILSAKVSCLI